MRFPQGLVVGFLLAIGAAYWHDRSVTADPDRGNRQLVNWDEFGRTTADVGDWVRVQFDTLTGPMRHRG